MKKGSKLIVFIVAGFYEGSSLNRGYQIAQELRKQGRRAIVIDVGINWNKLSRAKLRFIRNAIIIFVKVSSFGATERVKKKNNVVLWDLVDRPVSYFDVLKERNTQLFDGIIYPNQKVQIDSGQYFNNKILGCVLYHHWDPRWQFNRAKELKLCYIGSINKYNIIPEYVKIKDINIFENALKNGVKSGLFKWALAYNLHFSVRDTKNKGFLYKPNTKVSTAAATNSNIILSNDPSNIELLDRSYPYYTESALESVIRTIDYAKKTYKSGIWKKGLSMMKEVRERTHVSQIAKDYLRFLSLFD